MSKLIKAAVVFESGKLEIVDLPMPEPNEYEVLCKLEWGVTCTATDSHIINGTIPFSIPYPAILGHESVGRVVSIGKKAANYRIGDLVTRVGMVPCPEQGIDIAWGGYAQYGIAKDHWAMKKDGLPANTASQGRVNQIIPAGISPRVASMMTTWRETLSFLTRMGNLKGKKLLVIGSGGNGLSYAAHGVNLGASVSMLGNMSRKRNAESLGVSNYYDYKHDGLTDIIKQDVQSGFDYIVDAVGKANSLNSVISLAAEKSTLAVYGIDEIKSLRINPMAGKTFTFYNGGYDESETHKQVCDMILDGRLKADVWIDVNNPRPLSDLKAVFDDLSMRKAVKYLIDLA